jgi:hypothetical protein
MLYLPQRLKPGCLKQLYRRHKCLLHPASAAEAGFLKQLYRKHKCLLHPASAAEAGFLEAALPQA